MVVQLASKERDLPSGSAKTGAGFWQEGQFRSTAADGKSGQAPETRSRSQFLSPDPRVLFLSKMALIQLLNDCHLEMKYAHSWFDKFELHMLRTFSLFELRPPV